MMMTITVCVLSFNRAAYLCESIESILMQTSRPQNILIFDNGSKNDVHAAVEPYLGNGVGWVGTDVTHNHIWNFKRAIASASTDYVMVMHDDDRLCIDFIEKQIAFLQAHPAVGAVSCNGYLMDESGKRNGRLLRAGFVDTDAEIFKCSAEVAMIYANDGCIPFSPLVYKTESVKKIVLQEEFGKVYDAVFLCDFADIEAVAYQAAPLYECRIHDGQDSSHFPADLMKKLENFLWTRKSSQEKDILSLHKLLIRQHTARTMRQILTSLKHPGSGQSIMASVSRVREENFSVSAMFDICAQSVFKRLFKTRLG